MIAPAQLLDLGATWPHADTFAPLLSAAADRYQIDTPQRIACWLGQLAHESGSFRRLDENLNYSAEALARTWPARYADRSGGPNATAQRIARDPVAIANLTYANRLGNGDAASGDGWRYRGRGLIQLTGRSNYQACSEAIGLDLINYPNRLESPRVAALSAAWFWHRHQLNPLADRPASIASITRLTRAINGGTNGLTDRIAKTRIALAHYDIRIAT